MTEMVVIYGTIGYYPSQEIVRGEFGSAVYKGFDFNRIAPKLRRDAAVICFENTNFEIIQKEIEVYNAQTTTCENIHNYRWFETGIDKTLITAEPVKFTLYDVFGPAKLHILSLSPVEILKSAAQGVQYLHSLHIIHRAIKPQNFLVAETQDGRQIVKLSGFGISKKTVDGAASFSARNVASGGWSAPEILASSEDHKVQLTAAVDIFSLGCVFYFILSNGSHPFDPERMREINILENKFNLDKIAPESQEFFLIKKMISHDPKLRPSVTEVLKSSYFLDGNFHALYTGDGQTVPGYCLIINQKEFTNVEDVDARFREGTERDRDNLKETFEMFGFEVEIQENLTAAKLRGAVRGLSQRDLSRYQSLTICILSHGDENRVCGTDMVPVGLNLLKEYFNGVFVGKPKIFIIQACRGDEHQRSALLTGKSTATRPAQTDAISFESTDAYCPSVPGMSDFLEVYATMQGYFAYRCELEGSVFVNKLCSKIKKEGGERDLLSILLAVNEEMSQWSTICEDWPRRALVEVRQMSEVRHSLTKNIQLQRR